MSADAPLSSQRSREHQPTFNFRVRCGEHGILFFQEVSGLARQSPVLENRSDDRPVFSSTQFPVFMQAGIVTMNRGLSLEGRDLWNWLNVLQRDPGYRTEVIVELMDETGKPAMAWSLRDACPKKITAPGLTAVSRELAIESMEFACEGTEPRSV